MSDEVIFKPGREFSAIHIALDPAKDVMARTDEGMNVWNRLNEAYPEEVFDPQPAEEPRAGGAEEQGQSNANGRPAASQPASRGSRQQGSGLYCPEHPAVQAVLSKKEYQKYDDGPDGPEPVPARYFCPGKGNGTGENHSLWLRDLLEAPTSVPLPEGMPDEPDIDPALLPFHHRPSLDQ